MAEASAAYASSVSVEVEGPPKRPAQTECLLHSLYPCDDLSPLLFIGSSDGTLRSYVTDSRLTSFRLQSDYKRLFHVCCGFLDSWGVFATLTDNRLKFYDLPLQSNPQLDGSRDSAAHGLITREDTKGAILFAAHEDTKTITVLLKTNTLKVFDWTVNRVLEPRVQHELQTLLPSLLPVQQLLMLSESHVFIQGKKDWSVLNLDSGRTLDVPGEVLQQVNEALEGAPGIKTMNPAEDDEDVYGAFSDEVGRFEGAIGKAVDMASSHIFVKCLVVVAEKLEYQERAKHALFDVVTGQNWCEIGEAEIFLRAHRRFKALLAFYSARKLHRKALELLEDLERSSASAAALSEKTDEPQLQNTDDLQTSHDYMVLIAQYLRVLGKKHSELVFEFSRRVLSVNPSLGLSIFTQREVPGTKKDIDPAAVLQHLKTCSLTTSDSAVTQVEAEAPVEDASVPTLPLTSSQMLAIEYLTQVIFEGTCQLTPRLHDEVVYLLLDTIQAKTPQNQRLTSRVESQRGLTGLLRRKLLQFLEFQGAAYHPERMLSRTPVEMVDEHAALLSKLGRHREVLQLYALELKDAALAEAYCNRCYESKTADSSIYSILLRIYLRPPYRTGGPVPGATTSTVTGSPPKQGLWGRSSSTGLQSEAVNAAINVLNKYAERIDVSTALELLPADVGAAPLAGFFRRVLERQVQRFRNGQVKKQLSKMENFKVREQLSTKRKGSVTVWSSQCCQSCGKKLGLGTFVRLPNGALLHYSCQPVP
ncbi:hypothetical protein JM18_004928 [Phytophthora kernoviae]|uniref:CNH domain-containing protein n=2 Tax=Phytophthora kernoviae TaxID=325452 RepID=A0A8T0LTJ3_9STRA|nr:hypothetical protein G195_006119 [Phytophthora kernoviae 00238/432]KAG2521479.1 hypothetical protein JM16_006233 [Phytophthora kernoviae]KAG2525334.1 hypothetical protein JM18_004928 [Phytophthora kernoviae]